MDTSRNEREGVQSGWWTPRRQAALLLAVLLLASVLRMGWPGLTEFKGDEARLMALSLEMASLQRFPLRGISSSVGVPNFPASVWLYALPLFVSHHAYAPTLFTGLLNVFAVFGAWWLARRYWGPRAALLAALLFAVSPWAVVHSRKIWAQNLLPPLVVGWAISGALAFIERRPRWVTLHLLLLALAAQVHFAAITLLPATIIYLIVFRRRLRWRSLLAGAGLALWSLARRWRYPDALPGEWTLATWARQADGIAWTGGTTLIAGLAAALIAVVLVLGCLENEQRNARAPGMRALWLIYLPLLVPQVGFLFGAQVLAVRAGIDGTWLALVWSHLLFVLPYVFLSLADPYRALDERYARTALCLGARPGRVFWRIKLPMLLRPVLIAFAVGFAVSVAQYLPTLFAGAGRFATLTTAAVSLAAGGDRRVIGVYAFLQAALPLVLFLAALVLPGWLFRHRRALRGGA